MGSSRTLNELRRMSSTTLCLQVRGAPGSPAKTKADRAIVALANAGISSLANAGILSLSCVSA